MANVPLNAPTEIDKIVAEFLLARESGGTGDLETLCDSNPKYADGIRQYFGFQKQLFDSLDSFDSLGSSESSINDVGSLEIAGYQILNEIGRGGSGVVYEAIQTNLGRRVAIKVLKEGTLVSDSARQRFADEAKLIAQFQHEGIVDIIEYGEVAGLPFMVMPLIFGKSLNEVVKKGPVSSQKVAAVMIRVLSAIQIAHEQGVIHRDIKPANILFGGNLEDCKVSDFGLAYWDNADRFTQTGDLIGTAGFIAPEIIWGESKGDVLTDVYSVGATMYALLTGLAPFRSATQAESLLLAMNSDPIAPRKLNPGIPVDMESICLKCMNPAREKRYATVEKIADDIACFIDGRAVVARPQSKVELVRRWGKRNPQTAWAAGAAAALLAATLTTLIAAVISISSSNSRTSQALASEKKGNQGSCRKSSHRQRGDHRHVIGTKRKFSLT